MPFVPTRILLDHAAENGYALGAFSVNNMEQIQAVMEAAHQTESPVILQVSRGGRRYAGDAYLRHLLLAAAELHPAIPIAVHLDRGNSPATCISAIEQGFTSVMIDGSYREDGRTPADYDYDVRVTRQVVEAAHAQGVSVEGTLGLLGELEEGLAADSGEAVAGVESISAGLAEQFVADTGIDALAATVSTAHSAYKFSTREGRLLKRIEKIHGRLPNTHLSVHDPLGVSGEMLETIRTYGGSVPKIGSAPLEAVQRAIRHGFPSPGWGRGAGEAVAASLRRGRGNNA